MFFPILNKDNIKEAIIYLILYRYDVLTLLAGRIGAKEQAANVIMVQIWSLIFMNSIGISFSTTIFVGGSLGANKPRTARTYSRAALIFGFLENAGILAVYWMMRHIIIGLFTSNEDVTDLIMNAFIFYIILLYMDCCQGLSCGIIRAIGYQKTAFTIQFIALWCILFPLAYYLAFFLDYGHLGLWYAAPVGASIINIGYTSIILFAPWQKLAEEASKNKDILVEKEGSEKEKSLIS